MFIWAIIIHSFNKLFCFSYIFLRWDCGVHVIKHMQTFKNGDSMKASNLCNSVKIRQEIACDLILHEGNREKQTMLTTVCTKTSTQAMKKIIIMIFVVFLIFIISISTYGHVDWERILTFFVPSNFSTSLNFLKILGTSYVCYIV